jgi:hypothetical protein
MYYCFIYIYISSRIWTDICTRVCYRFHKYWQNKVKIFVFYYYYYYYYLYIYILIWHSSVSLVSRNSIPLMEGEWIYLGDHVETVARTHPASYPMGTGHLSQKVKWLGREADHLPPSNAEDKSVWSYTYTPSFVFMAWCLIKRRMRLHGVVLRYAQR